MRRRDSAAHESWGQVTLVCLRSSRRKEEVWTRFPSPSQFLFVLSLRTYLLASRSIAATSLRASCRLGGEEEPPGETKHPGPPQPLSFSSSTCSSPADVPCWLSPRLQRLNGYPSQAPGHSLARHTELTSCAGRDSSPENKQPATRPRCTGWRLDRSISICRLLVADCSLCGPLRRRWTLTGADGYGAVSTSLVRSEGARGEGARCWSDQD
jgi:hypothetical protein